MAQGSALRYEVEEGWEQLPSGYVHRDVAGVATDSEDRVYLICRGDHPIIVYDTNGKFLRSWGQGEFTYRTHGITVGPDEMLYCTDDGNHTVRKFTPDGKAQPYGHHEQPSTTGYDGKDTGTVASGRPSIAPRISRWVSKATSPDGAIAACTSIAPGRACSWGTPGGGPGEFFSLTAFPWLRRPCLRV